MSDKMRPSSPNTSQIESEAISWIAQLDGGEMSPADHLALAEWRARSPRHDHEIKRLAMLWGNIDYVIDDAVSNVPIMNENFSVFSLWRKAKPLQYVAIALSFMIMMTGGILFALNTGFWRAPNEYVSYQSVKGEQRSVTLSDGSVLFLNTNSLIDVKFTDQTRDINLIRGEVLFTVAKDKNRPFLVRAGNGIIRAVGTEFSVRLKGEILDVTVTEGKIRVTTKKIQNATSENKVSQIDQIIFLEAGHRVKVSKKIKEVIVIGKKEIDDQLAWRRGEFVFNGETLENIVEEIERYSPVEIVISDPDLRKIRMAGVFKISEIDQILDALAASYQIKVDRINKNLIYLKKGNDHKI